MTQATIQSECQRQLLYALSLMCGRFIQDEHIRTLDQQCTAAGEEACKILAAYGLIDTAGRGATWTEAGKHLLSLPLNQHPFPA